MEEMCRAVSEGDRLLTQQLGAAKKNSKFKIQKKIKNLCGLLAATFASGKLRMASVISHGPHNSPNPYCAWESCRVCGQSQPAFHLPSLQLEVKSRRIFNLTTESGEQYIAGFCQCVP
jgi:hypothetical protein